MEAAASNPPGRSTTVAEQLEAGERTLSFMAIAIALTRSRAAISVSMAFSSAGGVSCRVASALSACTFDGLWLTSKAGKVGSRGEGDFRFIIRQSFGEVRAIDGDDPFVRDDAGDAVVVPEDLAGQFFAWAGRADVVLKRILAARLKVGKRGAKGFAAVRVYRILEHMFHGGA